MVDEKKHSQWGEGSDTCRCIRVLAANHTRALRKNTVEKKSSWVKAPENFVSVNVDAAFNYTLEGVQQGW